MERRVADAALVGGGFALTGSLSLGVAAILAQSGGPESRAWADKLTPHARWLFILAIGLGTLGLCGRIYVWARVR